MVPTSLVRYDNKVYWTQPCIAQVQVKVFKVFKVEGITSVRKPCRSGLSVATSLALVLTDLRQVAACASGCAAGLAAGAAL
jgi:hypothetical protein